MSLRSRLAQAQIPSVHVRSFDQRDLFQTKLLSKRKISALPHLNQLIYAIHYVSFHAFVEIQIRRLSLISHFRLCILQLS